MGRGVPLPLSLNTQPQCVNIRWSQLALISTVIILTRFLHGVDENHSSIMAHCRNNSTTPLDNGIGSTHTSSFQFNKNETHTFDTHCREAHPKYAFQYYIRELFGIALPSTFIIIIAWLSLYIVYMYIRSFFFLSMCCRMKHERKSNKSF